MENLNLFATLLKRTGLTNRAFARKWGKSEQMVSDYKNGRISMPYHKIIELGELFGIIVFVSEQCLDGNIFLTIQFMEG